MKSVDEIVEPFKDTLKTVKYPAKSDICPDLYLFMKWAYRVEKGWYGFALGDTVPMVWARIIEEFLVELEKEAPNFKIHQIKLKFGGLRFYVDLNLKGKKKCEAIHSEIAKLESLLSNEKLIY